MKKFKEILEKMDLGRLK